MYYAVHGHTAAELIIGRANREKNIWDLQLGKMFLMAKSK